MAEVEVAIVVSDRVAAFDGLAEDASIVASENVSQ